MSAEYNAKFANTAVATRAIHAGQEPDPTTGAVVTPIYATSTFKQDGVLGLRGGHDYSRSINPTRTSFDEQLAAVEGAKYALSFSSGLAAIDVLLRSTIKPGDNILLGNDVYGGTYRPPPSTSAATPTWSAVPWCSTMRKPVSRWPSCRTQPVPCLPRSIRSLTFAA